MNKNELNTFQNLIRSNETFFDSIITFKPFHPDIYFKVELIIIFLKSKYSTKYNIQNLPNIIRLLLQSDYYIENEHIYIDNKQYTIEELYNIVRNAQVQPSAYATIPVRFSNHIQNNPPSNCKIINFASHAISQDYTLQERAYFFERTCRVDSVTIPFIREINKHFQELLDYLITGIVKDNIDIDEDRYYKVLAAYLKLYPYVDYAKNRADIPFENVVLPLNEIGLTKVKYRDEYLDQLTKRLKTLNSRVKKMISDTETLMNTFYIINQDVLERRNRQIIVLNSEIAATMMEYNEYSHNPSVLNRVFFEYIYEAFSHGHVIINEIFADPVLKLFTVKDKEVTSYIHIHLNTLLRLIDSTVLTPNNKKLELTAT